MIWNGTQEIKRRLQSLGVDVSDVPVLSPCRACGGNEEPVEISCDVFSGIWTVWCGCGAASEPAFNFVDAVEAWNRKNVRPQA